MKIIVIPLARRVLQVRAMKTTLALLVTGLLACSHSQPASQTPATSTGSTTGAEPATPANQVDPTLPSWAPKACHDYHTAVVNALACGEIAQATRDLIKKTYDERHASWQQLEDAPQGKIAEFAKQCTDDSALVHTEQVNKCGVTAAHP